jgi:hypothetical protein
MPDDGPCTTYDEDDVIRVLGTAIGAYGLPQACPQQAPSRALGVPGATHESPGQYPGSPSVRRRAGRVSTAQRRPAWKSAGSGESGRGALAGKPQ